MSESFTYPTTKCTFKAIDELILTSPCNNNNDDDGDNDNDDGDDDDDKADDDNK